MTYRTFIAVELEGAIRSSLARVGADVEVSDRIRWVEAENLHVTLKFLGDLEPDVLAKVCEAVTTLTEGCEPIPLVVRGVSTQPPSGKSVRVIWADVDDAAGGLAGLFQKVEQGMFELGFPRESRSYQPHVTLARPRMPKNPYEIRRAIEPWLKATFGAQRATSVVVFTSELTPEGPIYTTAARIEL